MIFLNCQGDSELIRYESFNSLYGSWVYTYVDSTKIILDLSPPNRFEILHNIKYSPSFYDTIHIYGSFELPASNIMYRDVIFQNKTPSVINEIYPDDTLIYYQDKNELEIYFNGRLYDHIKGKEGQLLHSEIYKVGKHSNKLYFHDLYRFDEDSLNHLFTTNESIQFPQDWDLQMKHKYISTDRQIFIYFSTLTIKLGYKFFNGNFVFANGPYTYRKTN